MTSEELKRMVDEWVAAGNKITRLPYDYGVERDGWVYMNERDHGLGNDILMPMWAAHREGNDPALSAVYDSIYIHGKKVPGTYIKKQLRGDG